MEWLKIFIKNPPDIPSYLSTGDVILDTFDSDGLEVVKNNIILQKDGTNVIDGALSFSLPQSPLNKFLLSSKIDSGLTRQRFDAYHVLVEARGNLLQFDRLRVLGSSDSESSFSVELFISESHPLKLAKDFYLRDIYFGFFHLTKENIEDQWDDYEYVDGGEGYFFGFDWFGKLLNGDTFQAGDMRPRYSPLALLEKGFRKIGYTFSSDILSTSFFRKTWLYIGDDKYGGNGEKNLNRHKFLLSAPTSGVTFGEVSSMSARFGIPLVKVYDNGDRFREDSQLFTPVITLTETITIQYELDVSNVSRDEVIKFGVTGTSYDGSGADGNLNIEIDLSVDDDDIYKGSVSTNFSSDFAIAWIYTVMPDDVIINKWRVYNTPISKRYYEGSYISMNDPISYELTLYDVLIGMQHLVGGVIDVNESSKSVKLNIPFDAKVFGEVVSGYYTNNPNTSLQEAIVCTSKVISSPDFNKNRYLNVGFHKSSDAYISHLNYDDGVEPFDKFIDIGSSFKNDTTENRNPIIEGSLLVPVEACAPTYPVHLCALLESYGDEEAEYSYDVGVRIGVCIGKTKQQFTDDDGVVLGFSTLNWYDENLDAFPVFFNDWKESNVILLDELENSISNEVLVYGSGSTSLWNMILSRSILTNYYSQVVMFSYYMGPSAYSLINLRDKFVLQYGYEMFSGIVDTMRYNFRTHYGTLELYTPIDAATLIDDAIISEVTDSSVNCADNSPKITISQGSVISFSLGGNVVSTVSSVEFYYRERQNSGPFAGTWHFNLTKLTNTSSTSAEVTNSNKEFEVQMIVSYEITDGVACPDTTVIQRIDPCGNNVDVKIQEVFSPATKIGSRRIDLNNSIMEGTVLSISATIRVNNGAEQSYYINPSTLYGDFVDGFDDNITPNFVLETLVINFTNGCMYTMPSSISNIEKKIIKSSVSGGIVLKVAGLGVAPNEGMRYVPDYSNVLLNGEPETTTIYYRNDQTDSFGEVWTSKGVGPVGYNPEFKIVFDYGDYGKVYIGWQGT